MIRLGVPLLLLWSVIPAIDEEAARLFKLPELISWLFYDVPFTFRLDHLWFLYYLLIFYSVLLLIKTAVPVIYSFILGFELSLSRVLLFWLPILILLSPLNKPTGGIFGNDPVIFGEINLGSMLFMASFFMIGMQAYKSSQFLENLQRIRFWLPSLIVFSLIPIGLSINYAMHPKHNVKMTCQEDAGNNCSLISWVYSFNLCPLSVYCNITHY